MAYNDFRSYYSTATLAAQNVVMSASNAIAPGTATTAVFPVAEATYLCSIAGIVTATPSAFPKGVTPYAVIQNAAGVVQSTATGQVTTAPTGTLGQAANSSAFCTFVPSVALAAGFGISIGLVATGTANATQTLGATTFIIGVAPQFV